MNAEFRRITRRDKKAFLSEQCKKKKNRGKPQNWKDKRSTQGNQSIRGIFHAQMGTILRAGGRAITGLVISVHCPTTKPQFHEWELFGKMEVPPSPTAVSQQQVVGGRIRNTDVQLLQGRKPSSRESGKGRPGFLTASILEWSLCFVELGEGRKGTVQVETPQMP